MDVRHAAYSLTNNRIVSIPACCFPPPPKRHVAESTVVSSPRAYETHPSITWPCLVLDAPTGPARPTPTIGQDAVPMAPVGSARKDSGGGSPPCQRHPGLATHTSSAPGRSASTAGGGGSPPLARHPGAASSAMSNPSVVNTGGSMASTQRGPCPAGRVRWPERRRYGAHGPARVDHGGVRHR